MKEGVAYAVPKEIMKRHGFARYGWTYGVMVVPFKYFPHDHSFEPSQTLGAYLGYRLGQTGWGMSLVASAGAATMKVSTVVDGQAKEQTITGFSYSTGLMFDIDKTSKPFQAGILVGRDRVGSNTALSYRHDGRHWISMQLGWSMN